MKKNTLSIVILTGNEPDTIVDCLKSASFADEIILVQTPACTPQTLKLARQTNPQVIVIKYPKPKIDFAAWHNFGSKHARSTWQLHLDTDERITPQLHREILTQINLSDCPFTNYDLPRANHFLGHRVKYGGTYPDYVKRLFLSKSLSKYVNSLHEQPQISGPGSALTHPLIHLTHRNLSSMLQKSLKWTYLEAQLLHQSNHPPIVAWRIIRMMLTKAYQRLIKQQMWRDHTVGWISAIFEIFDTYIIYANLWEIQKNET